MITRFSRLWEYVLENVPFIKKTHTDPTIKVISFPSHPRPSSLRKKVKKENQSTIQMVANQSIIDRKEQQMQLRIITLQKQKPQPPTKTQQSDDIISELRDLHDSMDQLQKMKKRLDKLQRKIEIKDTNQMKASISMKKLQSIGLEYMDGYKKDITQFRSLKYHREREYYPLIGFQDYQRIKNIWLDSKRNNKAAQEIKRAKNESSEKLTYKTMGRLQDGNWLNDQIINHYIELLQRQAKRTQNLQILNTYFATTTITKSQKVLTRYLAKKNILKESTILIPINHENTHWYFAKLDRNSLVIYDSLNKSFQFYYNNNVVKTLLKFGGQFFGEDVILEVCEEYPQQDNGYDCGVFTLMGLRDVMEKREWSFGQGDIKFKRIQTGVQVVKECLYTE